MKYISTRGIDKEGVSSAYAIKTGLAADGGLYMPEKIPAIDADFIKELIDADYETRAMRVLSLFLTDYTEDELLADAKGAYSKEKFGESPAPVTHVKDNMYMLELWHGPTCAFKDMALQIMPRLFTRALRKCGEERTALILVATSGDTGKAALEGYRDVEGTKIKVFYPQDGVSRVQKLQMQTQEGKNVSINGIYGNFDDAQGGVKRIFSDAKIAKELDAEGVFLSSANSINWGRLVPQIVYYISAYCDMVAGGNISLGEKIDVCVPTGNFGNIFAGFIAKLMGLPIEKLVCASNVNDVLTEFLETGTYNRNRPFHATISPSMDILISSNLERLLYTLIGADKTRAYMNKLNSEGSYKLSDEEFALVKESFIGYSTNEDETSSTIKSTYEKASCLIDTHTAVAANAAERYMSDYKTDRKVIVVSTASPYKFAKDVYKAVTGMCPSGDLEALDELSSLTSVPVPKPLCDIGKRTVYHKELIDKADMEKAVKEFAKS